MYEIYFLVCLYAVDTNYCVCFVRSGERRSSINFVSNESYSPPHSYKKLYTVELGAHFLRVLKGLMERDRDQTQLGREACFLFGWKYQMRENAAAAIDSVGC